MYNYASNTKMISRDKILKLSYNYHNVTDEFFILSNLILPLHMIYN